jgi:hypothetical protein
MSRPGGADRLRRHAAAIHLRLSILLGLARFGRDLRRFLAEPITPEQARRAVLTRLARREQTFLGLLESAVFGYPRSPYRKLFRAAGCELGDVRALVAREGLEPTLGRLRDAGVFVSFEEYKGTAPAGRGSQTFRFLESDFDNPLLRPAYLASTGGSRATPTRIMVDLDYLADRAPLWCLWFMELGLLESPLVFVRPYYPGAVNLHLICAKFGRHYARWFATARGGSLSYRLVARYLHELVARRGHLPRAEFVDPADPTPVGEYLVGLVRAGLAPCVSAAPSAAIRIAEAVGGDRPLQGITVLLGFEPLTRRRREVLEAAGARVAMTYGFSEGGTVGQQCRHPVEPDDVHIATDAFAVIADQSSPAEQGAGAPLLVTSLYATSPKLFLNAAMGDMGVLTSRRCGCLFDELGFTQHLHTIRSTHKITGEGVTFLGPDLAEVLEDALPRRFGGGPTSYQLVEQEGARGLARYRLVVSPAVPAIDERAVKDFFFAELGRRRPSYPFMVEQWARSVDLTVVRGDPVLTDRGKFLPFSPLRRD